MKLFVDNIAPSTLHSNVNKPYKSTYSTPNLEVHNGELTSLRSMGRGATCNLDPIISHKPPRNG